MPARPGALARLAARTLLEVATSPLSCITARQAVADGIESRCERFLAALDTGVWSVEESPLRKLLHWASFDRARLARCVRETGLEETLAELFALGVRVDADELAGRRPIVREGLKIPQRPHAFFNPGALAASFSALTSGSDGAPRSAPYSWKLFAEEAKEEALLLACHGVENAPVALWYPGPPSIAGVHNLLIHWKLPGPPVRWFSQLPAPRLREALELWAAFQGLRLLGRLKGVRPLRHVPSEAAVEVARWLAEGTAQGEQRVLKTFASSAVRVARAASTANLDIAGNVVFTGGEPLTPGRRDILGAVGLRAVPRFVATESGLVAGGCPRGTDPTAMHLYGDRLAVLVGGRPPVTEPRQGPLAFTSLSDSSPLVLLNAELGDHAVAARRTCDCTLGRLGMDVELLNVHAPEKIATAGIKFGATRLAELAASVATRLGGAGDDIQVAWTEDSDGLVRTRVRVSPGLKTTPETFRAELLKALEALPGGAMARGIWTDDEFAVETREPEPGPGHKHAPLVAAGQ